MHCYQKPILCPEYLRSTGDAIKDASIVDRYVLLSDYFNHLLRYHSTSQRSDIVEFTGLCPCHLLGGLDNIWSRISLWDIFADLSNYVR